MVYPIPSQMEHQDPPTAYYFSVVVLNHVEYPTLSQTVQIRLVSCYVSLIMIHSSYCLRCLVLVIVILDLYLSYRIENGHRLHYYFH